MTREFYWKRIFLVQNPENSMDDYPRALAQNLLESLDYPVELARKILSPDSLVIKNPVNLVPNLSPKHALDRRTEASAQDLVEYKEGGARH